MASRQDHELIYWRECEVPFQDYHNVRRGYDLAWCCCQNLTCRLESWQQLRSVSRRGMITLIDWLLRRSVPRKDYVSLRSPDPFSE